MSNREILITLIHNQDQARLEKIKPKLHPFASSIGATVREIYDQPNIRPISQVENIFRELIYGKLEVRHKAYMEQKDDMLGGTPSNLMRIISRKFTNRDVLTRVNRRRAKIERILTMKHVNAWEMAKSGFDFSVVIEDDAVFHDNTLDRFRKLLEKIEAVDKDTPIYVDLAGGFPLDAVGVTKFVSAEDDGLLTVKKMLTNTTCAYLINRRAAEIFMEKTGQMLRYKGINPDWYLNNISHELEAEKIATFCIHAEPPLLGHGSMIGEFKSLMR